METKPEFKSQNNLPFEIAPYHHQLDPNITWLQFKVGTCVGLWTANNSSYDILAIENTSPNNGHLLDTLQWFQNSCRRDKKNLRILETWNQNFKNHLISKHGFKEYSPNNLIKDYSSM